MVETGEGRTPRPKGPMPRYATSLFDVQNVLQGSSTDKINLE